MHRVSAVASRALISEKAWQAFVVECAQLNDWWVHHHFDSRRSEPGWPDLVLIRPPELLIVELKREGGKVTAAQGRVLTMLEQCHVDVAVWRPVDEPEVLERLRRR